MGEANLPVDSIFEILSLLPVKSLLRFESVSKSWCSLIHNPLFITNHLHQAAKTSSSSTLISLDGSDIWFSGVVSPGKQQSFNYKNHPCTIDRHRPVDVIGSCNGLLCLSIFRRYVIISNLLIKDHHITQIPNNLPNEHQNSPYLHGFGYDSVNDDYKVLIIVLCCNRNVYAETTVFSLRSNSWSQTKRWDSIRGRNDFPGFVISNDSSCITYGVFASGALHWLMGPRDSQNFFRPMIVAFDLATEEFYEISLPDSVNEDVQLTKGVMGRFMRLGVLKGCVCFSTGDRGDYKYHDVWVMEGYNVRSSWTKLLRIKVGWPWNVTPLMYSSEDRVLLLEERVQGLYWYDLRSREVVMKSVISNYGVNSMYPAPFSRFYTDSVCLNTLVSLDGYKALWRKEDSSSKGRKRKRTKDDSSSGVDDIENHTKALQVFFTFRAEFISFMSKC